MVISHKDWLEKEGGKEHPTHLETLQKPEQQARMIWLKEHTMDCPTILDIGCNWGYVTNFIRATCGVDKNVENIDKATHEFPLIHWVVADITKGMPFADESYHTVVMADVLEHIEWQLVNRVLKEALKVATTKILITLPWKKEPNFATCFKHEWIPNKSRAGLIITTIMELTRRVSVECDGYFLYIEVSK